MAQWLGINRSFLSRYKRPGNNRQRSANLKVLDAFITEWHRISGANESPASLRQTDYETKRKIAVLELEQERIRLIIFKEDITGKRDRLLKILLWIEKVRSMPEVKTLPQSGTRLDQYNTQINAQIRELPPWQDQYLDLQIRHLEEKIQFLKDQEAIRPS